MRYIANRSSGAQGAAIARALAALGAEVTFVTGPADVPPPEGVRVVRVQTARQMLAAVQSALPADAAVFAAAVADWRMAEDQPQKTEEGERQGPRPSVRREPGYPEDRGADGNRAAAPGRGLRCRDQDVEANATAKRDRKGCDWIVANDVSPETGIMGGTENAVTLISKDGADAWPRMTKDQVAARLAAKIAGALE